MIAVVVGNGDDDDDFDANYRVCSVFKFCMFDNSYWFGKIEKKVERRKNCEYSIWWDVWINRLHIDCYMMVMVMMIMKIEIKKEMKKKESINRIFDPFYSIQWKNRFFFVVSFKFQIHSHLNSIRACVMSWIWMVTKRWYIWLIEFYRSLYLSL